MLPGMPAYAIKAEIRNPHADRFAFTRQKTMYGGRNILPGDIIYLFASENEGGAGLVAAGVIESAGAVPRIPGIARQTPRVDISVGGVRAARKPLGRSRLKPFSNWEDGQPETELNFKFYRQATNKIVGISQAAADFLETHF